MSSHQKDCETLYREHLQKIGEIKFTRRQVDVMACLLHVWRDKDIARQLNISHNTVSVHLNAISEKVGSGGRQNILIFLKKSGKEKIVKAYYQFLRADLGEDLHLETFSQPFCSLTPKNKNPFLFFRGPFSLFQKLLLASLGLLFFIGGAYFVLQKENDFFLSKKNSKVRVPVCRSELLIPHEDFRLERPALLSALKTHFKRGSQKIKAIALVGLGGSGKTIVARQYARLHPGIVWEINAETQSNLKNSFETLAHHLVTTEKESLELNSLKNILDPDRREKKILSFVKKRLKQTSEWLLIFDNIEQFSDILPYFPSDSSVWGKGHVLLTTRNSHLHTHNLLHHSIPIGELSPREKASLFKKILQKPLEKSSGTSLASLPFFLQSLPSFPLDISIAAYYLKANNTSYENYLKELQSSSQKFEAIQDRLLKEVTTYSSTRYQIVILPIKKIMALSEDFKELLLFISLLKGHNIPLDFINFFKTPLVVVDFLHHLKKYSLVTLSLASSKTPHSYFTLHHIVQKIILSYFLREQEVKPSVVKRMFKTFESYLERTLEKEDIRAMKTMKDHLEAFLHHDFSVEDILVGCLRSHLVVLQYYLNDKALLKTLQSTSTILFDQADKRLSSSDRSKVISSFLRMGEVYTDLRVYQEGQKCLEKALIMIRPEDKIKDPLGFSRVLYHMGNLYRRLGRYKEALHFLDKSLSISRQHNDDPKRIVQTLSCLGNVYRGLGLYQKALEMLKEGLSLCQEYFPDTPLRMGRLLKLLGNVHKKLGEYSKAQVYLEGSLRLYKKYLPEDHMYIGLIMGYLGGCLKALGKFEEARFYLEKSLKIHEVNYAPGHPRRGWILFRLASTYKSLKKYREYDELIEKVCQIYEREYGDTRDDKEETVEKGRFLRNLGEIYLEKGFLEKAEVFTSRSLRILEAHHHVNRYQSYEVLGEIYLKRYQESNQEEEKAHYKEEARKNFKRALDLVTKCFSKLSPHRQNLVSHLKRLE